jgi:hypothetical protein
MIAFLCSKLFSFLHFQFLGIFSGFFSSRFQPLVYVMLLMYILTASLPFLACHLSCIPMH